jgi:hypothetical protein
MRFPRHGPGDPQKVTYMTLVKGLVWLQIPLVTY